MDTLLLEIGSEEIPAGYITPALEALASQLHQRLAEARIEHGTVKTYGTPRRLTVTVERVAAKQKPMKTELIGPPAAIGFDQNGRPTMAARKFAEKAGIPVERLRTAETAKGAYLVAVKTERALATRTLLKEILPAVILSTPFPKKMRWADFDLEFARPIQSTVALLGKNVIQFQLGNLKSGRITRGHYFMSPGRIKIQQSEEYTDVLRAANVLVDINERKKILQREIASVANKLGGRILPDAELEDINTNLVEYPVAVAGKFDEEFLEVPDEVLINSMREHQKYFAVVDEKNRLLPCFISVNNTKARDMALVARGHERVIRARLADAQFFYRGDLEVTNDHRVEQLEGVLFQAQLGTMHAKTERVTRIAGYLADAVGDDPNNPTDLKRNVLRAAHLCKADLVSHVVGEFPKLQGVMGRVYATIAGEPAEVASAIEEHYRPVYSGAPLPETTTGAILAIADKIDSICGCFSVGLVPTGASDPYALRRQGIGIVQIMLEKGFSFSLSALIEKTLGLFGQKSISELAELTAIVFGFIKNRMSHLLAEQGFSKDVIAAVVDISGDTIPDVWNRVRALESLKAQPDFEPLAVAFKRVGNIIKKSGPAARARVPQKVDATLFEHESEGVLYAAFQAAERKATAAIDQGRFDQALREIAALRGSVDAFFDGVMVMTDKKQMRENRLALLGCIAGLFEKFADFSKIST
ncbi:MAG: glycine--tRNA ligase subunit beta [Desulfobacterales bacterium]